MMRQMFALALLVATSSAVAAPATYVFDSVSKVDTGRAAASVTGILQGQATPTTVTWSLAGNSELHFIMSRCVPILLTMMEKPGRYLLNLEVDSAETFLGTINCGLELKN